MYDILKNVSLADLIHTATNSFSSSPSPSSRCHRSTPGRQGLGHRVYGRSRTDVYNYREVDRKQRHCMQTFTTSSCTATRTVPPRRFSGHLVVVVVVGDDFRQSRGGLRQIRWINPVPTQVPAGAGAIPKTTPAESFRAVPWHGYLAYAPRVSCLRYFNHGLLLPLSIPLSTTRVVRYTPKLQQHRTWITTTDSSRIRLKFFIYFILTNTR